VQFIYISLCFSFLFLILKRGSFCFYNTYGYLSVGVVKYSRK